MRQNTRVAPPRQAKPGRKPGYGTDDERDLRNPASGHDRQERRGVQAMRRRNDRLLCQWTRPPRDTIRVGLAPDHPFPKIVARFASFGAKGHRLRSAWGDWIRSARGDWLLSAPAPLRAERITALSCA